MKLNRAYLEQGHPREPLWQYLTVDRKILDRTLESLTSKQVNLPRTLESPGPKPGIDKSESEAILACQPARSCLTPDPDLPLNMEIHDLNWVVLPPDQGVVD